MNNIKGAPGWDDRENTFFTQTNNPTEAMLKKKLKERGGYLETCGPTAAVMCLAALCYDLDIICKGAYRPQPEEVLTDFLNDPRNATELEKVRKGVGHIPGNRIPQFYPIAVEKVFNARGQFRWLHNFDEIENLLVSGRTVQLCLKKPGHYIAAVAFDLDTQEIIYNDPWPARSGLKNGGFNERMSRDEYDRNVQGYIVAYS